MRKTVVYLMCFMIVFVPLHGEALSMGENAAADFAEQAEAEAKKNYDPELEKAKQYIKKGDMLFEKKKYKEAVKFYYAASKTKSGYKDAWKKVGFAYYQLKNHKFAFTAFKKVLELDPNDRDALEFMNYYESVIDKKAKQTEKREMIDPLWRSAVLPGWGQIHNGQMLKGIIISAGFLVSTGLMIYNVIDQNAKVDKYEKTNENHDLAYREAEEAGTSAMIFTLITIGIYVGAGVDAALNYNAPEARQAFDIRLKDDEVVAMVNFKY